MKRVIKKWEMGYHGMVKMHVGLRRKEVDPTKVWGVSYSWE